VKLRQHEATFARFQKHFPGTVAAGDGCAFRIKRPNEKEVSGDVQAHHTRKYSWAYGFLLFCDGDLNIMSIEASHVASTHDAGMYTSSAVHEAIARKELPSWAHVVLDEAFGCTDQELVAWSSGKKQISVEKDAFNYYLSAQRQSVERVFGVMHCRWGILWRPMSFKFDRYKLILVACSRLHNFIRQDRLLAKLQSRNTICHEDDTLWRRGLTQAGDMPDEMEMVMVANLRDRLRPGSGNTTHRALLSTAPRIAHVPSHRSQERPGQRQTSEDHEDDEVF
jgi:hypothetical protein